MERKILSQNNEIQGALNIKVRQGSQVNWQSGILDIEKKPRHFVACPRPAARYPLNLIPTGKKEQHKVFQPYN